MKWSLHQKQAIETLGRNVVVSASAGAGKTAVLTARLTKRVAQDHVPVTSILAMTFTEAAAAEMKSRLFVSLNNLLKDEQNEAQRRFLQDQLILLGSAKVSTIHSFCLSVIQENYFMINLDPKTASNILSDEECLVLKEEAWNHAVMQMNEMHPEELTDLCDFFSGRSDDFSSLKTTVQKIAQVFSESDNPQDTLARFIQYIQPVKTLGDMHPDIMHLFMDACRAHAICIENVLDEALDIISKTGAEVPEFHSHVVLRKEKLAPLNDAIRDLNYSEVYRILRNTASSPLQRVTKEEALKPVRKKIMDFCNEAVAFLIPEDQLIASINQTYPYAKTLLQLSMLMHQHYSQAKFKKQAMDFGDMEQYALKILLADNKRTAKKLQQQFEDILVDEFQDTNDVQNAIIELISRGNNIFRVGDIKQSIYRFRGARPQIMRSLIQCSDSSQEIIFLSENYRSCKSIVEFNNYLFSILMNVQGLSQEYTRFDWVSIGTEGQDDQDKYPVEFHTLTLSDESTDDESGDIKADYIAKEILSMKQSTEFTKWSDYCVLVRSHAVKDKLRYSFDKYGIPHSMAVKSGFYKSVSIQEIIRFFQVLLHPEDDLSLVSVLTSSFFKMDFETLAKIRIENKNHSYFESLSALNHSFISAYYDIKSTLLHSGIFEAYKKIIELNDFYSHLSIQEKTNLDLFSDRIWDFEQKHGSSLVQYLHFLNEVIDQPTSEAISASSLDDVVRIMTVHQSKGLQFPVVFFWSTFGTRIMDNIEKCMVDSSLGLGMMHIMQPYRLKRPTLHRLALEYRNTIEEFEENIRLLYVATTRPQKKLILVDQLKDNYSASPVSLALLYAKKGFSDLLLSGMNLFDRYQKVLPVVVKAEKVKTLSPSYSEESEIIRWTKQAQISELVTPSSFEHHEIGPLNLSGYKANVRGTQLHELVEQLPCAPWTRQQILSVDSTLHKSDIDRLLALGQHPFFLSLQNKEIHKEFSFILRDHHQISHGFIDYLAIDSETVTLIDFKSDRNVSQTILKERYKDQINAYVRVLHTMYPNLLVQTYLYSFELNQMIQMD